MIYVENELIGRRLKKVREAVEMEYYDMAKLLGVSEGHYRKIERGLYSLDVPKLLILYEKLDVNPLFLLTGKQEMKVSGYEAKNGSAKEQVCELLEYCREKIRKGVEV